MWFTFDSVNKLLEPIFYVLLNAKQRKQWIYAF